MNSNHYDGTTALAKAIADDLQLCSLNNTNRIAKLTKEACTALGLPIDTTGGKKSPAVNVAIFEWLRDNKTTSAAKPIDLPTVEPVAPAEEITEAIKPADVLPIPEVTTNADLFALETQNVNMPISINAIPVLPKLTATEARQKVNNVKSCLNIARNELLDLRDRDGWRVLGYESWEEFGDVELNLGVRYLNQITTAASIQNSLGAIAPEENIKETHLRPLTSIPENERAAIWEEANRKAEEVGKERTAKMVQDAANEWKAKHDAVQNDLLTVRQQNDDLRGNIDAKVSAVIATERADLVIENSAAIQTLEKQLSDAKDKIARDKKELDKAIADGVRSEMNALDNDIRRKEYAIEGLTERIESLHQTKSTLDKEVGELQKHNKAIEKIKDLLGSLSGCMFDLIDDENATPTEVLNDWHLIDDAVDKIKADIAEIINNGKTLREVIKSQPIDGKLV